MINIYNREIRYGDDCRRKMMEGVDGLADAVSVTMGPQGKNVVIKKGYSDPQFTKDGVTVARNVFFPDPYKNMGAEIISGVALRTGMRCGDGTSSATVLARCLLSSRERIKQSEVESVLSRLRGMAVPVSGKKDWRNVALVSSNGDEEVADLIANTIEAVGMDGQITIELSPEKGVRSEIVNGMSFRRGYASPYFVTNTEKMVVELDNPYILVVDANLHTLEQIFSDIKTAAQSGKSLLIIAREIAGDALQTLIVNKVKNGIKIAAVAAHGLATDFLEDIVIATGGALTERKFGSAKKVIIYEDRTLIIEGNGEKEEIENRCEYLRENKLKDRLARLSGGIAVLHIGGHTEAEASERRDRVDDALNATKSAIEEGIVPGGGSALYHAGRDLAEGAVKTATEAPIRQILKNAGLDPDEILKGIHDFNHGYDARSMRHCLMMESGIIDPLKVVCSAFSDAVSVAKLMLNTEAGIVELGEAK